MYVAKAARFPIYKKVAFLMMLLTINYNAINWEVSFCNICNFS